MQTLRYQPARAEPTIEHSCLFAGTYVRNIRCGSLAEGDRKDRSQRTLLFNTNLSCVQGHRGSLVATEHQIRLVRPYTTSLLHIGIPSNSKNYSERNDENDERVVIFWEGAKSFWL